MPLATDPTLLAETATRRTFAIISHPDAGKTTLTEKFLLYAGAVREAGAVQSRKRSRTAVSDWMALEQQRGISVSSTVLHFVYGPWRFNLLDTPGHADFSEDTYRTLCAADAAVMVLDLAKGIEPQTLKLFRVCRDRGLPIVTFVNKCDRPGRPPLELLDEIEEQIGLQPTPVTWPVADGADFAGIVDRRTAELVRFDRTVHGATVGAEHREAMATADRGATPADRWEAATEELALLDALGLDCDREAFLAGTQTPVFFGSALANFGVRLLLEGFARMAPPPGPRPDATGTHRDLAAPFSAFVFKVQANMDPRHRDRIAFMRVCSGQFERGMAARNARTGRSHTLKYSHTLFASDRQTVDSAVPGDIVGVVNATELAIGDTLHSGAEVTFPPIPTFAPEHFATVRNADLGRAKRFRAGIAQLDEEGVVQVLRRPEFGDQEPIFGAVGPLQFEVAAHRMATEFGCPVTLAPTSHRMARIVNSACADALRSQRGCTVTFDRHGTCMVLFASDHAVRWASEDHPEVTFLEPGMGTAPTT
ncbi:peptide chain release factor 3 [soil metagenome]